MRKVGTFLILSLMLGTIVSLVPTGVQGAAPTLTQDGVTPNEGSWITNFDFFVNYTDADNDAPVFIYVEIDYTNYSMTANDSTDVVYTDGKLYFYENTQFMNDTRNFRFWTRGGFDTVGTTMRQFFVNSSTIYNITGGIDDYDMECLDPQYADCLTYSTADFYILGFTPTLVVGQQTGFSVYQSFLSFDTSEVLDSAIVNYATIYVKTNGDASITGDFENRVYHNTSGTSGTWWDNTSNFEVSDYEEQGGISGGDLVYEGNILNTSHYIDELYFALNVDAEWINKVENVRYVILSSNYSDANSPDGQEYIDWYSADNPNDAPYMLLDVYNPSTIEIKNPQDSKTVFNFINLVAEVTSSNEVNEVTFQITGDTSWYRGLYDSDTDTYRYKNFDTKLYLSGAYYNITARVNFTNGESATDTVQVYIDNQAQSTKTYPADMTKGSLDGSFIDPYYVLVYSINSGEQTGTSINLRDPKIGTADVCISDQVHLKEYDISIRTWINNSDTATILENETFLLYDEPGCVNITVESSVSMTATRMSTIRRVVSFNWSYDDDTGQYSTSLLITNSLSYTMNVDLFYVAVAPDTFIDPKSQIVKDLSTDDVLDEGQDYGFDSSGFHCTFRGLASGDSKNLFFSYFDYIEGTDILIPTVTIRDGDLVVGSHTRSGKTGFTLARKNVINSNEFDYSGRVIVTFDVSEAPDLSTLEIDDSAGSNYDFFIETQNQVVIQGVSIDAHEEMQFLLYYRVIVDDPIASALELLPWIVLFMFIFGAIFLISSTKTQNPDRIKGFVTAGLALVVFGIIIALGYVVIKLQEVGIG